MGIDNAIGAITEVMVHELMHREGKVFHDKFSQKAFYEFLHKAGVVCGYRLFREDIPTGYPYR